MGKTKKVYELKNIFFTCYVSINTIQDEFIWFCCIINIVRMPTVSWQLKFSGL